MRYSDWLKTVPEKIREDALWNQEALHEDSNSDSSIPFTDGDPLSNNPVQDLLECVPLPGTEFTNHGTRNTEHDETS